MTQQDSLSRLRAIVKAVYRVPVLGYLVRLAVALARLPDAEAYHAHLLSVLSIEVGALKKRAGSPASERRTERGAEGQAALLRDLAVSLEGLRAKQAHDRHDAERQLLELRNTLDEWLAKILTAVTILEVKMQDFAARASSLEEALGSIDERVQAVADLGDKDTRVEALLAEQASALEGEVSAHGAELQRLAGELFRRIDFVRRETLFEARYGNAHESSLDSIVEARVLRQQALQVESDSRGYRLNVGCGHIPLTGYVNVDRRELPSVDVLADARDMPFEEGSVAEIVAAHLLEHFPQERLRRQVLPHWRELLMPGGTLRAVVPDSSAMIEGYREGSVTYEDLREVTFGAQDYDGDFHFNMFTSESLGALLQDAGFVDVECVASRRRNGRCFELEIVARKPEASPDESGARSGSSSATC